MLLILLLCNVVICSGLFGLIGRVSAVLDDFPSLKEAVSQEFV